MSGPIVGMGVLLGSISQTTPTSLSMTNFA
jgi:hypothetical protein